MLNKTPSQLTDNYYFATNESGFLMITTKGYGAVIVFLCSSFSLFTLVCFCVLLCSLVTLIQQPSELVGVPLHQHPNKCAAVVKNKSTPTTPSAQFTHPLFAMSACSAAGAANSSQAQVGRMFSINCTLQMSNANSVNLPGLRSRIVKVYVEVWLGLDRCE